VDALLANFESAYYKEQVKLSQDDVNWILPPNDFSRTKRVISKSN